MGECGVNTPPPSGVIKQAFPAIFRSKTCFPRSSPRRGAPALATPSPFSKGIVEGFRWVSPSPGATGRLPGSCRACHDWVG